MIEKFKNKNSKNYDNNLIQSLSLDDLYKNTKNNNDINNPILYNKINSEYSISDKFNVKNEHKKKIITDNKINELYENNNINNDINEKIIPPKINLFSSSSLNNLGGIEPYPPLLYDIFNRQSSNNIDNSNLNLNRFQTLTSTTFPNSFNRPPSLNNINKNILTPPTLNQRDIFNYYNNIKEKSQNSINNNSNNMLQINPEICTKKTLLSPPLPINNYSFPSLTKLTNPSILSSVNRKTLNNFNFTSNLNEKNLINENDKNSTLNMFNKKRKRDIKNNKLVFILGDNNKEKKEIKKQKINNDIHISKETMKKNDENSEKNRKPRGSKYRGVSRNGNQWQVLIMVNKKKRYVGSYSKEEDAARAYDKVALQNHGSKAKTNFDYTKKEVEEILASPQLLKIN